VSLFSCILFLVSCFLFLVSCSSSHDELSQWHSLSSQSLQRSRLFTAMLLLRNASRRSIGSNQVRINFGSFDFSISNFSIFIWLFFSSFFCCRLFFLPHSVSSLSVMTVALCSASFAIPVFAREITVFQRESSTGWHHHHHLE
jgi:hypothetical protein